MNLFFRIKTKIKSLQDSWKRINWNNVIETTLILLNSKLIIAIIAFAAGMLTTLITTSSNQELQNTRMGRETQLKIIELSWNSVVESKTLIEKAQTYATIDAITQKLKEKGADTTIVEPILMTLKDQLGLNDYLQLAGKLNDLEINKIDIYYPKDNRKANRFARLLENEIQKFFKEEDVSVVYESVSSDIIEKQLDIPAKTIAIPSYIQNQGYFILDDRISMVK
ncbi:MAG: hypothetical protein AB4057_22185 [Crocosphaera sp.]